MSERGEHERWAGGGGQGRWPEQEAWSPAASRGPGTARGGYSAPPPDVEQDHDEWQPRSRSQGTRSTSAPGRGYQQTAAQPGSRPAPRTRSRQPAYVAPLLLVVAPLFGALASGSSLGIVFTLACVAAAVGAAWLCTVPGLWWVVPCTPTALLVVALLWATFNGLSSAKTTVAAATGVFEGIAGAFPGIAAATLAALVVAVVRIRQGVIQRRVNRV